ncbi:MAG: glycosyltransferase family 2 protein [Syntrophales bacterium]
MSPGVDSSIFCSTIIATVGRSSLGRSVESILTQILPAEFEVIVVNDSGCPLQEADWQRSEKVTILHTSRRERCVARNTGAAIARGAYLHFLDDDDWMLPGGLKELWTVACNNSVSWVYGTSRLIDKEEKLLAAHHIEAKGNAFVQVMSGEWLPLQASLIRADSFFEAGGFDPRLTVCQDKDICRRVALRGEMASTNIAVACIVRDREHSTTNYAQATAQSVWSRDNILAEKGSFTRMWGSATTSYWRGRLVRAYLTCVHWNMYHRKIANALARFAGATAAFVLSAKDTLSRDFWRALVRSHTRKNVS